MTNNELLKFCRRASQGLVSKSEIKSTQKRLKGRRVMAVQDLDYELNDEDVTVAAGTVGVIRELARPITTTKDTVQIEEPDGSLVVDWLLPRNFVSVADVGEHCVLLDN